MKKNILLFIAIALSINSLSAFNQADLDKALALSEKTRRGNRLLSKSVIYLKPT